MEEISSMHIGSSSVLKKKRKGQKPTSLTPQKRQNITSTREDEETSQIGPLSLGVVELGACTGVSMKVILRLITLVIYNITYI